MYEMPDLATTIRFAQFSFLKTLLQQVTPVTAKKFSASTALGSRVFFRESGLDIIVGRQAIVEAFHKIGRPFRFYFTRANQVQAEHPPDRGMAFSRYVADMKGRLRSM
jgi:hypothetical protein